VDRLSGLERIVVVPGAVVTPAVRDELLRRNIRLVYGEPAPAAPAAAGHLAVITSRAGADPAGLLKTLQAEGVRTSYHDSECLVAAVDAMLVELAQPEAVGLLLTRHAAAGVCLANRVRGLRAVGASEIGAALRDAEAVGANLLVADPAGLGPFRLKQLALRFARGGRRPCPDALRPRLE
jgi:hypothetical protein